MGAWASAMSMWAVFYAALLVVAAGASEGPYDGGDLKPLVATSSEAVAEAQAVEKTVGAALRKLGPNIGESRVTDADRVTELRYETKGAQQHAANRDKEQQQVWKLEDEQIKARHVESIEANAQRAINMQKLQDRKTLAAKLEAENAREKSESAAGSKAVHVLRKVDGAFGKIKGELQKEVADDENELGEMSSQRTTKLAHDDAAKSKATASKMLAQADAESQRIETWITDHQQTVLGEDKSTGAHAADHTTEEIQVEHQASIEARSILEDDAAADSAEITKQIAAKRLKFEHNQKDRLNKLSQGRGALEKHTASVLNDMQQEAHWLETVQAKTQHEARVAPESADAIRTKAETKLTKASAMLTALKTKRAMRFSVMQAISVVRPSSAFDSLLLVAIAIALTFFQCLGVTTNIC